MLTIKTVHNNLIKQIRSLVGSHLSDITDPVTNTTFKAVIKNAFVTTQDDTGTLPEYPFIVVNLESPSQRLLLSRGLTTNDETFIRCLRQPTFKITCYGGDCTDILDKLQYLLEMDNPRGLFQKNLNSSTDTIERNSSVSIAYFDEIKEVPAFVETSFINTAVTSLKLYIESILVVPNSGIIEEIDGTLKIYNSSEDTDPIIEVNIHAP